MTEKVELKLQELKRIQSEEYYKKKDADLFAWGLTERDVSGKEVPVAITDEEYEELISAASSVNTVASRNSVAKALNIVAVCTIVVGFIIGFALMTIPYLFWDYDSKKQNMVMEVLKRRAEVTEKKAAEEGVAVSGGYKG